MLAIRDEVLLVLADLFGSKHEKSSALLDEFKSNLHHQILKMKEDGVGIPSDANRGRYVIDAPAVTFTLDQGKVMVHSEMTPAEAATPPSLESPPPTVVITKPVKPKTTPRPLAEVP